MDNPTHKGSLFGVPVYVNLEDEDEPEVEGRFFGCGFLLMIMESLFAGYCMIHTAIDPEFEPHYPIKLKEEL